MHVGSTGSVANRHTTPSDSSRRRAAAPASSSPTRDTRATGTPADASHAAVLPPAPPGTIRTSLGVSPPRTTPVLGPNQHVEPDVADDDHRPNGHARLPAWSAASSTATSAARAALASTSSTLARRLSPPELSWKNSSRRGRDVLARDALPGQLGQSGRDEAVVEHRVDLSRLGQRVGQDDAGRVRAEERAGVGDGRGLRRGLHPPRDGRAGVGEVEPGEPVGAVPQHRDRQRLQPLQGGGHVEDRLHAGADHEHRRRGEHPEVGRDVERLRRPSVHPAETAGREDPDPGPVGQRRGRGHRRRAGPAERDRDAEVAAAAA